MPYRATPTSPGYGRIVPILLGLTSVVLFATCLPMLDRNSNFAPMDPALHARPLDYVEDLSRAEGQLLRLSLHRGDKPVAVVTTRDDRPWRTFAPGEQVRLLVRTRYDTRGAPHLEYIVDDFAAKWGALVARAAAAVLCNLGAIAALLLMRRRPSAAERFPPPLPRSGRATGTG